MKHHIGLISAYAGTLDVPEVADKFAGDPLFSVFGLHGERYLTARFGGGLITSIHRKLGDLVEDSVQQVVIACLGLDPAHATYAAEVESGDAKVVRTADCFIGFDLIEDDTKRARVQEVARGMRDLLDATHFEAEPRGIGFEIRGCYQSADSKRAQADDAMARHLAGEAIVPLMLVFCDLSNRSIMRRYGHMWHLREGEDAFRAVTDLTGFDLQAFWWQHEAWIQGEINRAFDRLTPDPPQGG